MTSQELKDRPIRFNANIVSLTKLMPREPASVNSINKIVRSSSAPALMYSEACVAESVPDFIHTMGMASKELRDKDELENHF